MPTAREREKRRGRQNKIMPPPADKKIILGGYHNLHTELIVWKVVVGKLVGYFRNLQEKKRNVAQCFKGRWW